LASSNGTRPGMWASRSGNSWRRWNNFFPDDHS
jgi:hypothetical protein